jgi:hypothetical protein
MARFDYQIYGLQNNINEIIIAQNQKKKVGASLE